MITIRNLQDTEQLLDDPELWREVYGYLSVCIAEFLEYGDPEDLEEHDFNVQILDDGDEPVLQALGSPEEAVRIDIQTSDGSRCLYRVVYPSEILFVPEQLASYLPLAS
ncbi:hypothetical protein [Geoalkalibacter halelectricus]|uniref:Uncharacterized protein n=1 Tax=Geoalkalibacter halelectricus TaxID=2847045 RepID=A0ABY5ZHM4_9BACT|nr:hypothetical protein [Geoalkalibacter halelectricus]MDO3378105.1 hypothetical protein [Geoalkalibacter halelectricus]UWZ78399.1 hypothetical protein L9S41_11955 [Geoalkalibacter halelectricus]